MFVNVNALLSSVLIKFASLSLSNYELNLSTVPMYSTKTHACENVQQVSVVNWNN